jgi:hypothetical protein
MIKVDAEATTAKTLGEDIFRNWFRSSTGGHPKISIGEERRT